MPRTLLLVAVTAAYLIPAASQAPPLIPPEPAGPSDYLLFRFFFTHVLSVETVADNLKAAGKDDMAARTLFRDAAKLSDAEAQLIKSAARRCTADLDAHARTEIAAVVENLRAQHPSAARAADLPPAAAAQLKDLQARHEKIVTDQVQALKSAMGPDRFQKLYEFVRGTEAPRIRQGPASLLQPSQR